MAGCLICCVCVPDVGDNKEKNVRMSKVNLGSWSCPSEVICFSFETSLCEPPRWPLIFLGAGLEARRSNLMNVVPLTAPSPYSTFYL